MIRVGFAALGLALFACAAQAAGDDTLHRQCSALRDQGVALDVKIAACTAWIKAESLQGGALADTLTRRGDGYFWSGNNVSAIKDYSDALDALGDGPPGRIDPANIMQARGFAYQAAQRPAAAVVDFEKAIARHSEDAYAYLGLGHSFQQLGALTRAREAYDRAIALQPALVEAYGERGAAFYQLGDNTHALQDFGYALLLNPKLGWIYAQRARAYVAAGQFDLAVQDIERAHTLEPGNPFVVEWYGKVKIDAAAYAERLAAAPPPEPAPPTRPSFAVGHTHDCSFLYPDMSRRLYESGDVLVRYDVGSDGAIDHVALAHSSGSERLDRAAVACVSGLWRNLPAYQDGTPIASPNHQAIIRFSLDRNADTAADDQNRAGGLYALGGFDLALAVLNRAVARAPGLAFIYYQRGLTEYFLGQYDRAIADYDQALSMVHDSQQIQQTTDARDLAKAARDAHKPADDGKSI